MVYSDEPRIIGSRYQLDADSVESLRSGLIDASVSDLSKPENRYERGYGKLLEVYLPVRVPDGSRLLFEAYFRYAAVSASGRRIWSSFASGLVAGSAAAPAPTGAGVAVAAFT